MAGLALLPAPEQRIGAFTALALLANIAATTAAAAADGLMAITTAPDRKGSAAAWRMAGNVGGTGILGAGVMWVAGRTSVAVAGTALAGCVVASVLSVLLIHEPRSIHADREPGASAAREVRRMLVAIVHDLWSTVSSRDGWTGIVICAVPVGAGALTN